MIRFVCRVSSPVELMGEGFWRGCCWIVRADLRPSLFVRSFFADSSTSTPSTSIPTTEATEDPLIRGTLSGDWVGLFLVLRELRDGEFALRLVRARRKNAQRLDASLRLNPSALAVRFVSFSFSFSVRPAQPTPDLEDQPTEGISTLAEMGSSLFPLLSPPSPFPRTDTPLSFFAPRFRLINLNLRNFGSNNGGNGGSADSGTAIAGSC